MHIIEAAIKELKAIATGLKNGVLVICDSIISSIEELLRKLIDKPLSFCFDIRGKHICFAWELVEKYSAYHLIMTLKGTDNSVILQKPFIDIEADVRIANVGFLTTFIHALVSHV